MTAPFLTPPICLVVLSVQQRHCEQPGALQKLYSRRYGGRISSVLEVNSREGNKNKITGSAGIGLLTTKITLEGPVVKDKTSFILAGRTTYSDWLLGLIPENSGYNNGSANFYDLNAGISHKFNENNHLYVNGYFSRDRFSFNNENSYAYQNVNTSVKFRSILSDNSTMVLSARLRQI
jgi:outer membrane receptor for ferrienterochelin and colicin